MAARGPGERAADAAARCGLPFLNRTLCRHLLERFPDGLVLVRNWKVRYVSQGLLRMTGCDPGTILGRSFRRLFGPGCWGELRERYRRFLVGIVPPPWEGELHTGEGRSIPVEVLWRRVGSPGERILALFIRDLRRRTRLEEGRRRLLELHTNILENANVAVVAIDAQGRFTFFNRTAERISGYSAEEVLGRKWLWRRVFPDPVFRSRLYHLLLREMAAGRTMEDLEVAIRTRSGRERVLSWFTTALRDEEGRVIGGVGMGRDITEVRAAQWAAERNRRQVEALAAVNRVVLLTDNLEEALEAIPGIVRPLVDARLVGLVVADGSSGGWRLIADGAVPSSIRRVLTSPSFFRRPVVQRALRTGRPIDFPDLRRRRRNEVIEAALRAGLRSGALVPLVGCGRAAGFFVLASTEAGAFTGDLEFLTALGREVGLAVERGLLAREAERRRQQLEAVTAVSRTFTLTTRLTEALRRVPRILCREIGVDAVTLFVREGVHGPARFYFSGPVPEEAVRTIREPNLPRAPWNRRVLETGKPMVITEMKRWRGHPVSPHLLRAGLRSAVVVPVVGRGRPLGTLGFASSEPNRFNADVQFFATLGREVGLVIEHHLFTRELAHRERRLEALNTVARSFLLADTVEGALEQIPRILRRLVGAEAACLHILEPIGRDDGVLFDGKVSERARSVLCRRGGPVEHWRRRMLRTGRPVRIDDLRNHLPHRRVPGRLRSFLGVPVVGRSGTVGTLEFASRGVGFFNSMDEEHLAALGREIGLMIEHRLLEERLQEREGQLEEMAARLKRSQEDQRHRIAAHLHDDLGQVLSLAAVELDLAIGSVDGDSPLRRHLQGARARLEQVLTGMRGLAFRLEPHLDAEFDLATALRRALTGWSATRRERIVFTARGGGTHPEPTVEKALFRIALEAVQNALRHAHARTIRVTLTRRTGRVTLTVRDDGVGFDPARLPGGAGLGLRLMEDRARSIGARLCIRPARGKGTLVRVCWSAEGRRPSPSRVPAGRSKP